MKARFDELSISKTYSLSKVKEKNKDNLDKFTESFVEFKQIINDINDSCDKISDLNSQANEEIRPHEEIFEELNQIITENTKKSKRAREILKENEKSVEEFEKKNKYSSNLIFRKNILNSYLSQFQETMNKFQSCSVKFKESCRSKIKRRAKAVKKDLTEEELEELVESNDPAAFLQNELEGVHGKVLDQLTIIEEKHKEVKKIESGVKDIQLMFQDLALIVELQDEKLQNIKNNVNQTKNYTKQAVDELEKAQVHQKDALKCCLII